MMPRSSSVFSRSARIFEEMPSSDLVSSSRKCRRFPKIMSRMTSRLHLSPTTSSVRLIGQPERCASCIFACKKAACIAVLNFYTATSCKKQSDGTSMPKLRVSSFSVSLDGYGAGPDQSLQDPLGVGGLALHEWA